MSDLAGMGSQMPWLPPSVLRRQAVEEARERVEARRAEEARLNRADELHQRALMVYKEQAELRGEDVSVHDLMNGRAGRTVGEVLAEASAMSDAEDARARNREMRANAQPIHVDVGEPVIHTPMTPAKRSIMLRSRKWREWQQAKADAEAARQAMLHANDIGLVAQPVSRRSASPVSPEAEYQRACQEIGGHYRGDGHYQGERIRGGGEIIGIQ